LRCVHAVMGGRDEHASEEEDARQPGHHARAL
jgi:hypothetical protein